MHGTRRGSGFVKRDRLSKQRTTSIRRTEYSSCIVGRVCLQPSQLSGTKSFYCSPRPKACYQLSRRRSRTTPPHGRQRCQRIAASVNQNGQLWSTTAEIPNQARCVKRNRVRAKGRRSGSGVTMKGVCCKKTNKGVTLVSSRRSGRAGNGHQFPQCAVVKWSYER
jgi:hypothetical protein